MTSIPTRQMLAALLLTLSCNSPAALSAPEADLIPLQTLLAPATNLAPQISPDGRWISFLRPVEGALNLFVAPADSINAARAITQRRGRGLQPFDVSGNVLYRWTPDSRRILFPQDENGNEKWNLHVVDVVSGEERNVTPLPGVQVSFLIFSGSDPNLAAIAVRDRHPMLPDLYRLNLTTGERTLILRNDRMVAVIPDHSLRPRVGIAIAPDGTVDLYKPSGLGRDAPAARLVRATRASPATTRLPLGPLSADQVWAMIRELGRVNAATAGQRLATRVHEVTGGNPFYVIELLKTLLSQGWISVHPGSREWIVADRPEGEPDVGTMSPTVQEAIAQRVARLPDDLHAILMSIALSGPGCRTSALSHIHGISRLRAAAICDDLVERYFAVEDGGLYRCAHSVIASVVRAEMSTARRREIHRAIALALIAVAESGDGAADPGEVAQHAEQGGELRTAYTYALAASQASRERSAFEEALAWLDLASTCAANAEQTATVDRATATLLEAAGWPEAPALPRRSGALAISRRDFDLPGG